MSSVLNNLVVQYNILKNITPSSLTLSVPPASLHSCQTVITTFIVMSLELFNLQMEFQIFFTKIRCITNRPAFTFQTVMTA